MASTGEIAAFGKNVPEAYWNAYLSTNSFKPPRRGSGVLIGGDITQPELGVVAKGLIDLGFKLYTSNQEVTNALNSISYVVSRVRVKGSRLMTHEDGDQGRLSGKG